MALISVANMRLLTDKLALLYQRWQTEFGVHGSTSVAGTDRYIADKLLTVLTTTVDDYEQQIDMGQSAYTLTTKCNRKEVARQQLNSMVAALEDHVGSRGASVDSDIAGVATFLSYYNGGSGGSAFSSMIHPAFGDLWFDLFAVRLPSEGLYHPGIHPYLDAAYTNGMGTRAVGGSLTDGAAYESTPLYAEVEPLLEVIFSFATGASPPTYTVTGTDNTGASLTWTGTGGSNNPISAVATTITPALNAMDQQTFAVASPAGIVIGSTLKINAGLIDEEVIVVENVSGSDITATVMKAHTAGAALTGFTTIALTPGTAGRRMRDLTNIVIGIASHSVGTVRVVGKQERNYNPDAA